MGSPVAPPLRITAAEAGRAVREFQRSMNQGRVVPTLDPTLQELSDQTKVYIFNVGPWDHRRELGSAGIFFIPKCEKGKPYSGARPIDGIVTEPIPIDEKHMELRIEKGGGKYLAQQIMGVGAHLNPANSLTKYGVFAASGKMPTKEELAAANTALTDYYKELVTEARQAYAKGPREAEAVIRPELHFLAARELQLTDEQWMVQANPVGRQQCAGCGSMVNAAIIVCPTCRFIIDEAKYEKMKARFAS